jgi:hypothetical protein
VRLMKKKSSIASDDAVDDLAVMIRDEIMK